MDNGMEEYIRQILQTYLRRELSTPGRRLAAVLVPLYQHNGDYGVMLDPGATASLDRSGACMATAYGALSDARRPFDFMLEVRYLHFNLEIFVEGVS